MKYLKQFLIIILVSCIGELLYYLLPLPIPATIYGLVIMLGLLILKIVPLAAVRETAEFLIDIMPIMFIPAGVGLIVYWPQLKEFLIPICVIIVVSSILVMFATGKTSDLLIHNNEKGDANHE
ncbi:MAG: CidA/LrgA family protein [Faecalimonas sp.]|nr:CidA/LrgA family protein [Faecalimonas sp.]